MRERASLLGGTLTIESSPEEGTSVFVEIPLDREGYVRQENARE
jgi:signal transduction histidine kinase